MPGVTLNRSRNPDAIIRESRDIADAPRHPRFSLKAGTLQVMWPRGFFTISVGQDVDQSGLSRWSLDFCAGNQAVIPVYFGLLQAYPGLEQSGLRTMARLGCC